MSTDNLLNTNNLPRHIAIIMDGNGRWAKQKSKLRIFGHSAGVKTVKKIVEGATEIGIKYLTLYAFSSENWKRPKFEINALMELLIQTISSETKTLIQNNIKLVAVGDLSNLPKKCLSNLEEAIEKTKDNERMTLVLALSYGSREEIVNSTKKIVNQVLSGDINVEDISEDTIKKNLYTHNIPDPELLIRTSGENRISNFLLWQIAYSELYFTDTMWPDFTIEDLKNAIIDYQARERRFGKTSEQIKKENA